MNEQSEAQSEVTANEEQHPCRYQLVVEYHNPRNIGMYKESRFAVNINSPSDVFVEKGLLRIHYYDDHQLTIKYVPMQNVVDWSIRYFDSIEMPTGEIAKAE